MTKKLIYIRDLEKFIWTRLLDLGYIPESQETDDLAKIFFEYLFEIGILVESEEEEFDT